MSMPLILTGAEEVLIPAVFEIEKTGMHLADKIIAVSNLTRNTIIEKYGIHPDKVVTVYNAVEPIGRS